MSSEEMNLGQLIGTAFVSFIITNIDDLVLLLNFFTEATMPNSKVKASDVFIGQYFGFIIILAISLIGYGLSYALPVQFFGFLGFIPIILGIQSLIQIILQQWKKRRKKVTDINLDENKCSRELERIDTDTEHNIDEQINKELTIDQEKQKLISNSSSTNTFKQKLNQLLTSCFNLQTLKIATITLANGSDNISVYMPLFAEAADWRIVIYIAIFLLMVFVWLISCYFFLNIGPVLSFAQNYAHYIVPFAFIGIGIYIVITSKCFPWLVNAIQTNNFQNG